MFFRDGLASFLHLFGVFAFIVSGSFLLALSFFSRAREHLIESLTIRPAIFLQLGAGLVSAGMLLTLGYYLLHRGKYLRLKMGKHQAEIDVMILQEAIEIALKKHFEEIQVAVIGGRRLEIEVLFPKATDEEKITFLERAQTELTPLLREQFGLTQPFYLTAR